MGLKFVEVNNYGQSFVLILILVLVYLSVACRSATFTLAKIVLAMRWKRDGNRWLWWKYHHIALVGNDRKYIAIIVNGCQRLATFSNCLKKLPSVDVVAAVAVVSSIVNELLVSFQLF